MNKTQTVRGDSTSKLKFRAIKSRFGNGFEYRIYEGVRRLGTLTFERNGRRYLKAPENRIQKIIEHLNSL